MQVSVEKISNVLRKLTITVPANQVEEAYLKRLNQVAKQAKIKGFRPGKAPMSYITQQFGEGARQEAIEEVIKENLSQAISKENLKLLSINNVEPKAATEKDQLFEFTALLEVLPEIENVQLKLEKIEKLSVEVTPEDIDRVVQQLVKQYTKWRVVERPAQEKDRVIIDYNATFEGNAENDNKIQDLPLELGGNTMIPGFEEGLIGLKAGEDKALNLQFPTDFSIAERAGKPIDFNIKIKQVLEAELPALNEDFIKQLGIKTGKEEDLKDQIKKTLEHERDRLVNENLKEQVFGQLLEQNPVDAPDSLVANEAKRIHDEIYAHQPNHNHHQHSHEELESFKEIAKKRVALSLLISEYARQANLKANEERIQKRIEEIASAYEKPREVIAWLSSKEQRRGIELQVIEDQVMEKLLEGTSITEKVMSYADLKGIRL